MVRRWGTGGVVALLRVPVLVSIALAIAFGGGVASSIYALDHVARHEALTVGPWAAWPDLQTARADPYALAYRARRGDILLGEAEGLAFTARTDSSGRPLTGACRYEISGNTPAARLWTLRATDASGRPLEWGDPALPHGFQSHDVLRRSDGSFAITVSDTAAPGNWLALGGKGPVEFVLTLFDTPAAGNAGLIGLDMPAIRRLGCGHA